MITDLKINSLGKEPIEMFQLTKNVIVLFNNNALKYKFVKEFFKIALNEIGRNEEFVVYSTVLDEENNEEEEHKAELNKVIEYLPTTIYDVDNEQRFIFTVEGPFVYQCKDAYDLWFCDENPDGEVKVWALTDFKGYKDMWDSGLDTIYSNFVCGVFGCYEGYGR